MMDEVPKKDTVSVTSVTLYSLFRISWSLNMGPTGCPEMSARNYHSTLYNIPVQCTYHDDLVMKASVWLHMVRFRAIHFGAVRFSASYANLRQPHIFK
jgi:hypothetical protein